MNRCMIAAATILLAGCEGGLVSGSGPTGSGTVREFLVIGSSMTFEQCRASGGLIIRDANSPMTACDPSVKRNPVSRDALDDPITDTDMNAALEMQDLAQAN